MFYFGYKIFTKEPIVMAPEEEKEAILKVKFTNMLPELAETVKDGDEQVEVSEEMLEGKKVVRKKIVAKIEKIISNEPAEFINLMVDGKTWSITGHPKNRDLVLEIKVLCRQKGNDFYFSKNLSLKIGLRFNFSTDLYSISGVIVEMRIK